tara:strand:+ start:2614 stop:5364 length:2751 start_codon:yes stop_codon:yes gene_type:complete
MKTLRLIIFILPPKLVVALFLFFNGLFLTLPLAEAAKTTGNIRVLGIRIDFSDAHNAPSLEAISKKLKVAKSNFERFSFGRLNFVYHTVEVKLGKRASYTASEMATRADLKATNAGHNTNSYNIVGYYFGGGSVGSHATVGGKRFWAKGTGGSTIHEMGHNFNFGHQRRWVPNGDNPIGLQGKLENDPWQFMKSGGIDPDPYEKWRCKWITGRHNISSNGSFTRRLYNFDQKDIAKANSERALRVKRTTKTNMYYWIGYRSRLLNKLSSPNQKNYHMRQGLVFYWDRGAAGKSVTLLDLHQGTGGTDDQALQPGETFSDNAGNVYITNLGRGGAAPNEYIDVRINRGNFTGNRAPQPTWDAPNQWPAGEPLTVSVEGNDPDGDEVACMWRNGGIPRNTSATSLTFTKNNIGKFSLSVQVSDMKGKTTKLSKTITIVGGSAASEWIGETNNFWYEGANWSSSKQPNSPDAVAVWKDSFTGENQLSFSNPVVKQLRRIRLEESLNKDVVIEIKNSEGTLELFDGGIDMSESLQNLTLQGIGSLKLQANQRWVISSESRLNVEAEIDLNGKVLSVATQTNALFSGNIIGDGGISVTDSGTLTLIDGKYSGKTIVENGRLEVVGTLARSEIIVNEAGILGGTGQIGGGVFIAENANLCPGSQSELGSLTFMDGLKLDGNIEVQVNPDQLPNCDQVNVSGALEVEKLEGQEMTKGSVKIFNIGGPYAPDQVFQIFNKPLIHGGSKAIDPIIPGPGLLWDNRLYVDGSIAVIVDPAVISYDQWAENISGLSGPDAAFEADPNKDGTANGLAFVLGASDALVDTNNLLPQWDYVPFRIEDEDEYPGEFIISYRHSQNAAISVSSALEYSIDTVNWTLVAEDEAHITIETQENYYGSGIDQIKVHFLDSIAPERRFLVRLKALP